MVFQLAALLPLLALASAFPAHDSRLAGRADEPAPPIQVILHTNDKTTIKSIAHNYAASDVSANVKAADMTPEQAARKMVIYNGQEHQGPDSVVFPGLIPATYPGMLANVDKYEQLDGQRVMIRFKVFAPGTDKDGTVCAIGRDTSGARARVKSGDSAQKKTAEFDLSNWDWADKGEVNAFGGPSSDSHEVYPVKDKGDDALVMRCMVPTDV